MAAPRNLFLALLALILCSARAVRPESDGNVTEVETAAQEPGPCPKEGQERWVFWKRDDRLRERGHQRVHCLPRRSLLGSDEIPKVRDSDKWCCGPSLHKKCQKACISRPAGQEDCVDFCENPDYMIANAEQDCPEVEEVYRFMKKNGAAGEEHRHCLPQREKFKKLANPTVTRVVLSKGDRGCCSGHPDHGKVCFEACVDGGFSDCMQFCEDPEYSEIKPLHPCPPDYRCFRAGCEAGWYKTMPSVPGMTVEKYDGCYWAFSLSSRRPPDLQCYMLCQMKENERKYRCERPTESTANFKMVHESYCG